MIPGPGREEVAGLRVTFFAECFIGQTGPAPSHQHWSGWCPAQRHSKPDPPSTGRAASLPPLRSVEQPQSSPGRYQPIHLHHISTARDSGLHLGSAQMSGRNKGGWGGDCPPCSGARWDPRHQFSSATDSLGVLRQVISPTQQHRQQRLT